MHVKRLIATAALAGACVVGGFAATGPAYAAAPSATVAPAVATHWILEGSYFTATACRAEGQFLVAHVPNDSDYLCEFHSDSDAWVLYVEVTPQS